MCNFNVLFQPTLSGEGLVAMAAKMRSLQVDVFLMFFQLDSGEKELSWTFRTLVGFLPSVDSFDVLVQTALTVVNAPTFHAKHSRGFLVGDAGTLNITALFQKE